MVNSVVYSPDGKRLVTASMDGSSSNLGCRDGAGAGLAAWP